MSGSYNPDLVKQELLTPKEEPPDEVPDIVPQNAGLIVADGLVPKQEPIDEVPEIAPQGDVIEPVDNAGEQQPEDRTVIVQPLALLQPVGNRAGKKPIKWRCPCCPKSSAHDSGMCNTCRNWIHTRCAGFKSHKQFPANFICQNCSDK